MKLDTNITAGLVFQPRDITFTVPISINQFEALLHCDDDTPGIWGSTGVWNYVRRNTPISSIDYHLADEGPYITLSVPAAKYDDDIFMTIAGALWTTLDACVAEHDKALGEEE